MLYKFKMPAAIEINTRRCIRAAHSFRSPLQLAWHERQHRQDGKMGRFSMLDPEWFGSAGILRTTRCDAEWRNGIITHIYWLVSQTVACFVHSVPHLSSHGIRNPPPPQLKKERQKANTSEATWVIYERRQPRSQLPFVMNRRRMNDWFHQSPNS